MKVSVIIPLYNAEKYIEQAIKSALLEEVGEIIVIDDKYPDKARQICENLKTDIDRLRVYEHPDKKNHGAGASRNLGVSLAQFDYIAFLDADDYYLPNRFKEAEKVFRENPDADGTYGSTGSICEKEVRHKYKEELITTLRTEISPKQLFWYIEPIGKSGYFTTNGITLKKAAFYKAGGFNTSLKLSQDTNLWLKLTMICSLFPDSIHEPIAIRRLHEYNRHTDLQRKAFFAPLVLKDLLQWSFKKRIDIQKISVLCFTFLDRRIQSISVIKKADLFRIFLSEIFYYIICSPIVIIAFPFLLYFFRVKRKAQFPLK